MNELVKKAECAALLHNLDYNSDVLHYVDDVDKFRDKLMCAERSSIDVNGFLMQFIIMNEDKRELIEHYVEDMNLPEDLICTLCFINGEFRELDEEKIENSYYRFVDYVNVYRYNKIDQNLLYKLIYDYSSSNNAVDVCINVCKIDDAVSACHNYSLDEFVDCFGHLFYHNLVRSFPTNYELFCKFSAACKDSAIVDELEELVSLFTDTEDEDGNSRIYLTENLLDNVHGYCDCFKQIHDYLLSMSNSDTMRLYFVNNIRESSLTHRLFIGNIGKYNDELVKLATYNKAAFMYIVHGYGNKAIEDCVIRTASKSNNCFEKFFCYLISYYEYDVVNYVAEVMLTVNWDATSLLMNENVYENVIDLSDLDASEIKSMMSLSNNMKFKHLTCKISYNTLMTLYYSKAEYFIFINIATNCTKEEIAFIVETSMLDGVEESDFQKAADIIHGNVQNIIAECEKKKITPNEYLKFILATGSQWMSKLVQKQDMDFVAYAGLDYTEDCDLQKARKDFVSKNPDFSYIIRTLKLKYSFVKKHQSCIDLATSSMCRVVKDYLNGGGMKYHSIQLFSKALFSTLSGKYELFKYGRNELSREVAFRITDEVRLAWQVNYSDKMNGYWVGEVDKFYDLIEFGTSKFARALSMTSEYSSYIFPSLFNANKKVIKIATDDMKTVGYVLITLTKYNNDSVDEGSSIEIGLEEEHLAVTIDRIYVSHDIDDKADELILSFLQKKLKNSGIAIITDIDTGDKPKSNLNIFVPLTRSGAQLLVVNESVISTSLEGCYLASNKYLLFDF